LTLREFINLTNIDPRDLASSVGCSYRALQSYVSKVKTPSLEVALRLYFQCDECVSLEEMLSGGFYHKPRRLKLKKKLKCPNDPYLRDCYRLLDDPDKSV